MHNDSKRFGKIFDGSSDKQAERAADYSKDPRFNKEAAKNAEFDFYAKMDKAMDPLVELMQKTDQVHIVGPGTDLTFSVKGMPANKCAGKENVPDGEVFTAPARDSAHGTIT